MTIAKLLPVLVLVAFGCDRTMRQTLSTVPEIPGLKPEAVYNNLTDRGFTQIKFETKRSGETEWIYESKTPQRQQVVQMFGHSTTSVVKVIAFCSNFSNSKTLEICSDFFEAIATIPYVAAEPEKAKAWVLKNFDNENASTEIGGVKFAFSGSGSARTLLISKY